MGHFKSFLLGMGVAYTIYYITRKDREGRSLVDELVDHPEEFVEQAKNYAVGETMLAIKNQLD